MELELPNRNVGQEDIIIAGGGSISEDSHPSPKSLIKSVKEEINASNPEDISDNLAIIHNGKEKCTQGGGVDEANPIGGRDMTQWGAFIHGVTIGWNILKNPAMVFLLVGACVRHAGKIQVFSIRMRKYETNPFFSRILLGLQ